MPDITPYYALRRQLKLGRWRGRRLATALRWGPQRLASAPVVFGNAMPKSGSHLIIQVLYGLTRLGPFVNPGLPPVNRWEDNRKLSENAILNNLHRMRPGDIGYGYIKAREPFLSALSRQGMATVFVYRDPRDVIVSHVFYATEMHAGHGMHQYYSEVLETMEERINAAIQGVDEPDSELSSVRVKYENYLGWLETPDILCMRFEDLILTRDAAISRLLDYLESRGYQAGMGRDVDLSVLKGAIAPGRSGTFRKGQPGNWKEHFTPANKALFKDVAGDLLICLGYEQDDNW